MSLVWSLSGASLGNTRFLGRTWGDERVVYDVLTGDTHYLEPFTLEILNQLTSASKSQLDLIQDLNKAFIFSPEEDVTALTESTLAKLHGIGLVATAS